ncbi:hypothetical protein [Breoghania sp.]|uniref:hypothetical protein n=1 Tax=Breoghania sp. TaxID=2065378 RepID=UPI002607F34B|nr:hypothetical protein [Breoghania sp.]
MTSANQDHRVTLFPMIHIGEAAFYEKVVAEAFAHDTILTEGVKSPVARRIKRTYRWVRASTRLSLRLQSEFRPKEPSSATIVRGDLSTAEFEHLWRDVPFWMRFASFFVVPMIGLKRLYLRHARNA